MSSDDEAIEALRARLETLRTLESEIEALRARQRDLEVARIADEVTAGAPPPGPLAALGRGARERLIAARARARAARTALEAVDARLSGAPAPETLARLREAREALAEWLGRGAGRENARARAYVHLGFLAAVVATVWVALTVHLAFLVLLVPIGGAVSFVLNTGHDTEFRRLGARRRYERTGLPTPGEWTEAAVRERLAALDEELARADEATVEPASADEAEAKALGEERETLAQALTEAEEAYRAALEEADLDPEAPGAEIEAWLDEAGAAAALTDELAAVERRLAAARREAERARDEVYRFLSRRDALPGGGRADAEALGAALERVAAGLRRH